MANTFRLHTFDGSSTGADTDMVLYTVGSGATDRDWETNSIIFA